MKFSKRGNEAIIQLQNNPDWKNFLHELGDEAERLNMKLVYNNPNSNTSLETMQGMTREIVELLQAIEKAPENFKKASGEQQ